MEAESEWDLTPGNSICKCGEVIPSNNNSPLSTFHPPISKANAIATNMPVTIRTCNFKAETWKPPSSVKLTSDPHEILQAADPDEAAKCDQIWACSSPSTQSPKAIAASPNGLIHAVVEAWNNHYSLVLRPDDFWFAIISQLSFYITANAEALRSHFVAHDGKKGLEVEQIGTIRTVNYALFADAMADKIGENVKDPGLKDWILPDFSTTTHEDRTVAAVLFMGAMQKYFEYFFDCCDCAIPEVTLLGEREDWAKLQARLPQLLAWGDESKRYHGFLAPILKNIVASFDDPGSESVIDFWKAMVSPHGPSNMSGAKPYPSVTGWVAGLFLWNHDGKVRDDVLLNDRIRREIPRDDSAVLDGVYYPRMHLDAELIPAVATVPVTVRQKRDDGTIIASYDTRMMAGICGFRPCEAPQRHPALGSEVQPADLGSGQGAEAALDLPPLHCVDRKREKLRLEPGLNTVKLEAFWWIYKTKQHGLLRDL